MADETEAERLNTSEEEDEGGPIKSFLEHLEDLRWVLIKSLTAAGVAMLICLLAGNYVVEILKWPLKQAPALKNPGYQTVRVMFGTNQLSVFHIASGDPLASVVGTNTHVQMEIQPVLVGTNLVLGINPHPDLEATTSSTREKLFIDIVNLSPAGAFVVATKVAFYGGLVISSPFIFYFVAAFIFPALRMREKKYVYRGLAFGGGLFLLGVTFCYFILMPIALAASAQYAQWLGFSANQWRAEDYISFVCKFLLGMGLGFELPVVVLTLVKIGVLNYRILAGARRYVIVICFVLGAILTTPEVVTQVLMAIPLLMLYEISVWITWYWERKEKKLQEQAEKTGSG
jgi:sec-independent protein translocase protein TatC